MSNSNQDSQIQEKELLSVSPISGSGMDRRRESTFPWWRKIMLIVGAAVAAAFAIFIIIQMLGGRSYKVPQDSVVVSTITEGAFENFIPVRSMVTPLSTVFLDAIEGGQVDRIIVEDGTVVKKGDVLAELSNTELQLEVIRNDAAVVEQLNNIRATELALARNTSDHKLNLVEINYQIKKITREVERYRKLMPNHSIPRAELDASEDSLQYYLDSRQVTIESQSRDEKMQNSQLAFLKSAGEALEKNLIVTRKSLENLHVRAPVDGKLSGFDLQVGQNIPRGARMGQLDDPSRYKLRADIDEFYLGQVELGQFATLEHGENHYKLKIAKIYPQVINNQFKVDLMFDGQQPEDIRSGQTLQIKLILGGDSIAKLIPNGAFYESTGGNWIFVLMDNGHEAVKREIRLGRKNPHFIEVLDGLEIGDRVLTSEYTDFIDMDRLKLTSN